MNAVEREVQSSLGGFSVDLCPLLQHEAIEKDLVYLGTIARYGLPVKRLQERRPHVEV